jgi:plastocyanin
MTRLPIACSVLLAALTLTACGGQEQPAGDSTPQTTAAPAPAATNMGENLTPDPGGKIIVVQMMTDDQGNNRYEPAEFEAHQGDVVRFTLKAGVHNANFLPDSNAVKTNLPPATPLLQLPGQTIDIKVTMPPGNYYFHCDPHALLGMKGKLEVEAKD